MEMSGPARTEQTLVFADLPALAPLASDALSRYAEGLESEPEQARARLATLPIGARLIQQLRSPYTFQSEAEILTERERILAAMKELSVAEFSPLDALAAATRSPITMAWLYHGMPDHELRRPYGELIYKLLGQAAPDLIEPLPDRKGGKLRVGYLSPQLRNSNSSRWAIGLANAHPRSEIELFSFDVGPWQDERTQEWKQSVDNFFRLEGSVLEMGRAIQKQNLDVLLFTDIGIDGITDVLGSMRLARRQATLWGGPCSSGLVNVDFYLGGDAMIEDESEFSEKVIRLPGAGVFYEPRLIQPALGRPAKPPFDPMLFCIQTLAKCHPHWDSLFARLAETMSVPILLPPTTAPGITENTAKRFKAAGVRAMIMPKVPEPQFTGILSMTSLSVDTPFYNGGITAILALAAGAPIVTMAGQRMRDRFGKAFLEQVGLGHWVAKDEESYLNVASNWAQMRDELSRAPIADLFEDKRVTNRLNEFLLEG